MTTHPAYEVLSKMMKNFQFNVLFIHQNYTQILQTDYEILKSVADSYKTFCYGAPRYINDNNKKFQFGSLNGLQIRLKACGVQLPMDP